MEIGIHNHNMRIIECEECGASQSIKEKHILEFVSIDHWDKSKRTAAICECQSCGTTYWHHADNAFIRCYHAINSHAHA